MVYLFVVAVVQLLALPLRNPRITGRCHPFLFVVVVVGVCFISRIFFIQGEERKNQIVGAPYRVCITYRNYRKKTYKSIQQVYNNYISDTLITVKRIAEVPGVTWTNLLSLK